MDITTNEMNEENQEVTMEMTDANSLAIQEIMKKAITDEEFKERLLENPDEILDEYEISEITRIMIKSLTREDYDKLTPENIAEYFSADSPIYTPDFDESIPIEYAGEDEI